MASPVELKCCGFKNKPQLWCGIPYAVSDKPYGCVNVMCVPCLVCEHAFSLKHALQDCYTYGRYDIPSWQKNTLAPAKHHEQIKRIEATFIKEEDKQAAEDMHAAERKLIELQTQYKQRMDRHVESTKRAFEETLPAKLEDFQKTACCDRCKKKRKQNPKK